MKVVRQKDLKANIRQYFDMAFDGEAVVVPRKENRNVVIISEDEYRQLEKARNNLEYLLMLRKSEEQIRSGRVVAKTMEELEAMSIN
ncbi:MAG: type II toxin-antitoxin system Phd/YefM family antitoxin [Oscillibacter sp.]|nr:type II toxin-antitoxin system Phd/YefM family antitoxin [Oscillibacter sp.]